MSGAGLWPQLAEAASIPGSGLVWSPESIPYPAPALARPLSRCFNTLLLFNFIITEGESDELWGREDMPRIQSRLQTSL